MSSKFQMSNTNHNEIMDVINSNLVLTEKANYFFFFSFFLSLFFLSFFFLGKATFG